MNAADEAFFARRSARTSQTSTKAGATDTSDSPNAESGSKHKARRSLGRRTDPDEATRRRNRVKKTQNDRSRKIDESLSSLASFRKSMARKTSRVREARAAGAAEAGGGAQEGGKADKERRKKKKHKSPVVLTSPFAERGFPTILRGKASLTPSPGTVDRISRAKSGAVSQTFDSWMQKKKKKTKEKKGAVGMEKKKKRKHDDVRRSGSGSSSSSSPASPASVSSSSSSRSRSRRKKTKEKEKEEQKKKRTTRSKLRETHEKLTSKTKPKSKVTVKIMRTSASPKRSTSPNVSQQRHGLPKSYMDDLAEMKVTKLSFSDDDDDDMPLRGGAKPGLKRTQTIAKARTPTPKKAGERRGQKSAGSGSGGSSSSSRSPVRKAVAFSDLSKDQQRVYRMTIDSRKNVLMLGEGGTGKTELIKLITKKCKGLRIKVEVTASTGKAALLIGGSTLHSFAGVKKGYGSVAELLALVRGNRYCRTRWRNTKLLILDEVSMISAELLYKLDRIARAIRPGGAKKPFGGMQILASGDFLQLPPVKADYCFKHECFDQLFPVGQRIVLTHNFRQDKDPQFREVLQAIRWGNVTVSADCLMRSRVGVLPPDDQPASIIFPLRRQVDELNKEKMAELTSKVRTFKYEFFSLPKCSAKQADYFHNLLLESTPISRGEKFHGTKRGVLELKVGARVMHTCNNKETGKVNGSLGTVVGFEAVTGNPVVKWADGTQHAVERHTWATNCQKATLVQYPLIVAWAITVHKAQGATLDAAIIDLGPSIFEYNQAYTAASRVRRLQDLYLLNWQRGVARPHYEALKFYADLGVALAQKVEIAKVLQAQEGMVFGGKVFEGDVIKVPQGQEVEIVEVPRAKDEVETRQHQN